MRVLEYLLGMIFDCRWHVVHVWMFAVGGGIAGAGYLLDWDWLFWVGAVPALVGVTFLAVLFQVGAAIAVILNPLLERRSPPARRETICSICGFRLRGRERYGGLCQVCKQRAA
jgi:hypothetical protein